MKAILVIDVEECGEYYVDVYRKDDDRFEGRHYLKPMPKEEDIYEVGMDEEDTRAKQQWNKGWNACLEEIEKC